MTSAEDRLPPRPAAPEDTDRDEQPVARGSAAEVFAVFTRLGITSFGGPAAHLGYFRDAVVTRRRWLSDTAYAEIVGLCQFLPGPASSQVGMALGLRRSGLAGMLAAWLAFTLPSAVLMVAFAATIGSLGDVSGVGWLLGMKAAAVAVVAQAVLGMTRTLAPDARRATIAATGAIAALLVPAGWMQLAIIAGSAVAGLLWRRTDAGGACDATDDAALSVRVPRWMGAVALAAFAALLIGLPPLARAVNVPLLALFTDYVRSGALVFGGGHVVLPLLEAQAVGTAGITHDQFLAGYGAAQAVPGPLFSIAAYLGYLDPRSGGILGAAVATVGIFLPGALLVLGVLPFWQALRAQPGIGRAVSGMNAGVVGLLGAVLYDPVLTQGIGSPTALAVAIAAFVALMRWRVPAWAVVVGAGLAGQALLG